MTLEESVRYTLKFVSVKSKSLPNYLDHDIIRSSCLGGALRAFETYNPERGTTYKTYLVSCISHAFIDGLRKSQPFGRTASPSSKSSDKEINQRQNHLGHSLSRTEIEEIKKRNRVKPLELDSIPDVTHHHIFDFIEKDKFDRLTQCVKNSLTRQIVEWVFWYGYTLQECSEMCDLSPSACGKRLSSALISIKFHASQIIESEGKI